MVAAALSAGLHLGVDALFWAALYGLGLGGVGGGALAISGPLSQGDERPWEAGVMVAALAVLGGLGGAFLPHAWEPIGVALGGTVLGGAIFWLLCGGEDAGEDPDTDPMRPLGMAELRRAKREGDCWVLVTGSAAAGKSALVERMVAAARQPDGPRLAAPVRAGEDGGVHVTELRLRAEDGERRLRFWERAWDVAEAGASPSLRDIDGLVLAIDATCVRETAGSFPAAVKAGAEAVDVHAHTVALDDALARAGRTQVTTWQVITKADLIRFSIDERLVREVKAGADWYEQLHHYDVQQRSALAALIGVQGINGRALSEGRGSPFLAYAGQGAAGDGSFGGDRLLGAIVEVLAQGVLRGRRESYAR